LKKIELVGKRWLDVVLRLVFARRQNPIPPASEFQKILILRLDQRIGNGLLLLPLLMAIRRSRSSAEIHLLLHQPVGRLIERFTEGLVDVFWMYDQKKMLSNPPKFLIWLTRLRRQHFDLVISSHNPDNFSLSQAILGRWCNPQVLAGFRWANSPHYYDVAVKSSAENHYSESQLDLWRNFDGRAELEFGGLHVPEPDILNAFREWKMNVEPPCALFWLGATGNKTLPPQVVEFILEQVEQIPGLNVKLALGPADAALLRDYPERLAGQTLIWRQPLEQTAIFFAGFDLFISGDTGPMHLAAALGIPTLTIFTGSNMRQYGYNDGHRHISVEYRGAEKDHDVLAESLNQIAAVILNAD